MNERDIIVNVNDDPSVLLYIEIDAEFYVKSIDSNL